MEHKIGNRLIDSFLLQMLSEGELDGGESDTENAPEVDLLEQLSKLQIGNQSGVDQTASKASSKVLLRSNPVFDDKRMSSKVNFDGKRIAVLLFVICQSDFASSFRKLSNTFRKS